MIRVAHITTIDLSLRYLLLNQLKSIQDAGYSVTAISSHGPYVREIEEAGIPHIAVEMTRRFSPLADLRSLVDLMRVLRAGHFDIVHTHNPKPGLLGQIAARLVGAPIVVNTLHGFYFHDGMDAKWRTFYINSERIAALCSDVIFSQNPEDIQTAIREKIAPASKYRHLGNGIDLSVFDPSLVQQQILAQKRSAIGLASKRPVIGFVGRLVTEKGILELLEAMKAVRERVPDVQLLIVGPVDEKKSDSLTPAVANDYGMADCTFFTGMRNDMADIYAMMDVFVLPSHREGFPRSPMEASAMGKPCIVTDIRGCRETVEQGRNGWLVPAHNARQLAEAILILLENPPIAAYMGAEARTKARREFDERQVFAKVMQEYSCLVMQKL